MRYIDKLLNYFSSAYNNNTKYHHSTLGFLKIFFERNNKLKSTFSTLGNVFRNSKWSDLKIQNIKTSFIKSWTSYFVITLVALLFLFSFFGVYAGNIVAKYVPFLGEIFEIIAFYWLYFENWTKAAFITLFASLSALKSLVLIKIKQKQNYIYSTIQERREKFKNFNFYKGTSLEFTREELKRHKTFLVIHEYTQVSSSLADLRNLSFFDTSVDLMNLDEIDLMDVCWSDTRNLHPTTVPLQLTNIEYPYAALPTRLMTLIQWNLTSLDINSINFDDLNLILSDLNLNTNLNNAKEDRWFLHNTLLSEDLTINSNKFTQSKKLLGLNLLNSNNTSKNVWNSTKFNSLDAANTNNVLSNLQELVNQTETKLQYLNTQNFFNGNLDKYNFFENSRMWLTKKFFYNNQLKHNSTTLTTQNKINTDLLNSNNTNFNIYTNLFHQDLNLQTQALTLSTYESTNLSKSPILTNSNLFIQNTEYDLLKLNNLVFLNTLNSSTTSQNIKFYSPLVHNTTDTRSTTKLIFKK